MKKLQFYRCSTIFMLTPQGQSSSSTYKRVNFLLMLSLISGILLSSCGFALRGRGGSYKFPFQRVYVECVNNVVICKNLKTAIQTESLAILESSVAKADVTIRLMNEQTARDPQSFNAYGRISAYILTYQAQAQLLDKKREQLGENIDIVQRIVMQYNDSTILADTTEEKDFWNQLHEMATNQLIHKIVYFKALKELKYETESK